MIAHGEGKPVQWRDIDSGIWSDVEQPSWLFELNVYRPKPAPKTRPWSKRSDISSEPVIWLKLTTELQVDFETMIVTIGDSGVRAIGESGMVEFFNWMRLRQYKAAYSTNRNGWHPCEVAE